MAIIHLGSDHAGYELKEFLAAELKKLGHEIVDHGCHDTRSCDYALVAHPLCEAVAADNSLGILVCGSGIGMSMAANRHKGLRAALCCHELMARLARRHNNANILCLGARVIGSELALATTLAFLDSSFEGGRHERRVGQIEIS